MENLAPELQQLVQKAATVLPTKIKKCKTGEVKDIIASEFPINYPITDTGLTVLSHACSLTLGGGDDEDMLNVILAENPDVNT